MILGGAHCAGRTGGAGEANLVMMCSHVEMTIINNLVHVAAHHIAGGAVVAGEQGLLHASLTVLGNSTTNLRKVELDFFAVLKFFTLSVSAQTSWE